MGKVESTQSLFYHQRSELALLACSSCLSLAGYTNVVDEFVAVSFFLSVPKLVCPAVPLTQRIFFVPSAASRLFRLLTDDGVTFTSYSLFSLPSLMMYGGDS
jgi:hypothetical protein